MWIAVRKFFLLLFLPALLAIAGCSNSSSSSGSLEQFPDTDGDGINNGNDGDIDGDGTPNQNDGDIDGDGLLNEVDPDPNGGPGVVPPTPELACTSIDIYPPNSDWRTGSVDVRLEWKLLPKGCELKDEQNPRVRVTAFNEWATPDTEESQNRFVGTQYAKINIPNNCSWDSSTTKKITYSFRDVAAAVGVANPDSLEFQQDVTHPVGRGACEEPEVNKPPVVDLSRVTRNPAGLLGGPDSCEARSSGQIQCAGGSTLGGSPAQYFWVWHQMGGRDTILLNEYESAPTWSVTGDSFMNIYVSKWVGLQYQKERVTYRGGGQSEWDEILEQWGDWTVRKDYAESPGGVGWWYTPIGGNFILRILSSDTTISKYEVPEP